MGRMYNVLGALADSAHKAAAYKAEVFKQEKADAASAEAGRQKQLEFYIGTIDKEMGMWGDIIKGEQFMQSAMDPGRRKYIFDLIADLTTAKAKAINSYLGLEEPGEQHDPKAVQELLKKLAALRGDLESPENTGEGEDVEGPGVNARVRDWINANGGYEELRKRLPEYLKELGKDYIESELAQWINETAERWHKEATYGKSIQDGIDWIVEKFKNKEIRLNKDGLINNKADNARSIMETGGEQGGSETQYVEPASESVTWTEEAINNRLSQQPWNDPNVMEMGTPDLYPTNIPKGDETLEAMKRNLVSELTPVIRAAESNVNGYNAVAGSSSGDADLLNMTIKQIREKYGNKAVGVGQFKYNVFIKPIAEKYLNMNAKQLDNVVFSKQFQDQLIALAAEDAGMTQLIQGKITPEEFQKRFANIFRGVGSTKESSLGEEVDEYGNKVRSSGKAFHELLKDY